MLKNIFLSKSDLEKLITCLNRQKQQQKAKGTPCEHLRKLEKLLKKARVVEHDQIPNNAVTLNSTITLHAKVNNQKEEITLVFPGEECVDKNNISVLSPLGVSLLGLRVGESMEFFTGHCFQKYQLIKVQNEPLQSFSIQPHLEWDQPMMSDLFYT